MFENIKLTPQTAVILKECIYTNIDWRESNLADMTSPEYIKSFGISNTEVEVLQQLNFMDLLIKFQYHLDRPEKLPRTFGDLFYKVLGTDSESNLFKLNQSLMETAFVDYQEFCEDRVAVKDEYFTQKHVDLMSELIKEI